MNTLENLIEKNLGEIEQVEIIQELWSGYGHIKRLWPATPGSKSVIAKQVSVPEFIAHPKGWDTPLSHIRKMRSYEVEQNWYKYYAHKLSTARTPKTLASAKNKENYLILMEDLNAEGFSARLSEANLDQMRPCIGWLAHFHACFLGKKPEGLWETGSYWHLETRPDELEKTKDIRTQSLASLIDKRLSNANYKTIIHGDAKLANFCFTEDLKNVAAVDFQYVGGGCGMKDLAYFVSSCLNSEDCFKYEEEVLSIYFKALKASLSNTEFDIDELEKEWRGLYQYAWADFYRFLKGWSPEHWKVHNYSMTMAQRAQRQILDELLNVATMAAKTAGDIIQNAKQFKVHRKDAPTIASEIVTDIDYKAQEAILSTLAGTIQEYDLGLLSEEQQDDKSRFSKDYFWSVDPLDGTLAFSEGRSGHAVSIALVNKKGQPILGVVYDPVENNLYHATLSGGSFKNGIPFKVNSKKATRPKLFADQSLKKENAFEELSAKYEIVFGAGAVMNSLSCIENAPAKYIKFPKDSEGGGSLWDFAAASLIVNEAGGSATDFYGAPLDLNREDSTYMNHKGVMVTSD